MPFVFAIEETKERSNCELEYECRRVCEWWRESVEVVRSYGASHKSSCESKSNRANTACKTTADARSWTLLHLGPYDDAVSIDSFWW